MDIRTNESISLLDQARIQAQVLVPVLHALREEMGKERADALVGRALRDWSRSMALAVGSSLPGSPRERWDLMQNEMLQRVGADVQADVIEQDDSYLDVNITRCGYAEFFKSLGEPELGGVLLCDADFHQAEASEGTVELARTQTIMKGAAYCDFRYRFRSK